MERNPGNYSEYLSKKQMENLSNKTTNDQW